MWARKIAVGGKSALNRERELTVTQDNHKVVLLIYMLRVY